MYDAADSEQSVTTNGEGFSEEEIASFLRVRQRIAEDSSKDIPAEYKRLKFARWLVENNLLED